MADAIKICFVSNNIYPLLKEDCGIEIVGGAEVQQMYIAKELINNGYEISFITLDYGQKCIENIGPYKIIASYAPKKGFPFIRFFYPVIIKIWKALLISKADIFYVRTAGSILAPVVIFAKIFKKKVIYCAAHNKDFKPELISLSKRDKRLFYWALKHCDRIISQNNEQKSTLFKNFKLSSSVVPNGLPKISDNKHSKSDILWVATIKKTKCPDVFLELAKRIPDQRFVMVGGKSEKEELIYAKIKKDAEKISNLEFKGFIPFSQIEEHFSCARIFINTSSSEGFPNTFLQAWRKGIPVITFYDLDNIIDKNGLGSVVEDIDEMQYCINKIISGGLKFSEHKIIDYFNSNFTTKIIGDVYKQIFFDLFNDKK